MARLSARWRLQVQWVSRRGLCRHRVWRGASRSVLPLPLGFLCRWVSCSPGGGASSSGFTRGLLSSAVLLVLVLVFFVGMCLRALSSRRGVAFLGWRLFLACPVVNRGGLGATLVLLGLICFPVVASSAVGFLAPRRGCIFVLFYAGLASVGGASCSGACLLWLETPFLLCLELCFLVGDFLFAGPMLSRGGLGTTSVLLGLNLLLVLFYCLASGGGLSSSFLFECSVSFALPVASLGFP